VIGGPGAFVLRIVNFDAFAQAMTGKLGRKFDAGGAEQTRKLVRTRSGRSLMQRFIRA
jgi:hypothetical protein